MILSWPARRRLWRFGVAGALAALAATVVLDHLGNFGFPGDDWANFDRHRFRVVRAIQSDILEIQSPKGPARVKLAGVNGPHIPGDFYAAQALDYTRNRTVGREVTLRLEPLEPRDACGQLIAHVYLLDTDNLNADMVKDGIVYVERRMRSSLLGQYEALENEARRRKYGLWKSVRRTDMPVWRQKWLEDRANRQ